ncbi:MAG: DUF1800 domain-containing protein [Proteobacteria bacterium]|nr:DUF1800 domain-containing protein [Pseudomonadota bacterium]
MKKVNQNLEQSRRKFLGTSAVIGASGLATTSLLKPNTAHSSAIVFSSLKPLKPSPLIGFGIVPQPPMAALVLNKAGFGPRPGDIEAFNALGVDDITRITAWVNEQLNPTSNDPDVDDRMAPFLSAGMAYDTIDKTAAQLWSEHVIIEGSGASLVNHRPRWQMERLFVLRGLYSKWQLKELMNDFWFNHFNVKGNQYPARSMLPNYDREIRSRIFGNFYDMLLTNSKTVSMLFYLDNNRNSWPNPNENYAREVLELHTLGAIENYYGAVDPSSIGNNIKGDRTGYTEIDVFEFAKALTGWSIADGTGGTPNTGEFTFRSAQHYNDHINNPINVMAISLTVNGGENDVTDILRYLADHYGTARFIAWKLCTRLVGDNPADTLVTSTADVFYSNNMNSEQLRLVYEHILMSAEFRNTWGAKVKRPLENIISAMRAADVDIDFRDDHSPSDGVFNELVTTGQRPFDSDVPTGFPDEKDLWIGSAPLISSWRTITYFLEKSGDTYDDPDTGVMGGLRYCNIAEQANTEIPSTDNRTPSQLVDMWMIRLRGYSYNAVTRNRLITYVMDKSGLTADQAFDASDSNDIGNNSLYHRINYTLVGLIMMSPDAIRR